MTHDGFFYFDPEDGIYADHFPGHPIVPGSLIVQAFVHAIETKLGSGSGLELDQFRFKQFIEPGTYRYSLDEHEGQIRCRLYAQDKTVVTGKVIR